MRKSPNYAFKIYIGYKAGDLIVDSEKYTKNNKSYVWCKCTCGNRVEIRTDSIIGNKPITKSCGCKHSYYTSKNHNKRIGSLVDEKGYKVCRKCLVKKISQDFCKLTSTKDGLNAVCRQCKNKKDSIVKIGYKFNLWEVIDNNIITEHITKNNKKIIKKHFKCRCQCGKENIFSENKIKLAQIYSCGCHIIDNDISIYTLQNGFKFCDICEEFKKEKDFNKNSKNKDGLDNKCKECSRNYRLNSKYDISNEEYERLFNNSQGKCHCCGKARSSKNPSSIYYRKLVVDHCHNTGIIRGLLCHNCNIGIGLLSDNIEGLQKAYEYLRYNKFILNDNDYLI
jgi:hypothetical protein